MKDGWDCWQDLKKQFEDVSLASEEFWWAIFRNSLTFNRWYWPLCINKVYESRANTCNMAEILLVFHRWVLYEKPGFKGEKFALDEGDMELTNPFSLPEEQLQNGHQEERPQGGEPSEAQTDSGPPRGFIIGSIRRAVRVRRAHAWCSAVSKGWVVLCAAARQRVL